MTSPAKRAYNVARTAHKSLLGSTITVSRGLKTSASFVATVGQSGSIVYEDDGSSFYTKNRDYYIDVSDYHFTGDAEPSAPQRMDIITEIVDGQALTFQITNVSGEEEYVHHGEQRNVYRIHTKEV
jgi:hypothetical protein